MVNTISLDTPTNFGEGKGSLHDVIGNTYERNPYDTTGRKPMPLKSSWGMDDHPHAGPKKHGGQRRDGGRSGGARQGQSRPAR